MLKVCLDLHDFSVVNHRLDLLLRLKERYPDLKVSLFTVPYDLRQDFGSSLVRDDSLRLVKENLSWIQIVPHGLYHNGHEAKHWDGFTFREKIIPLINAAFVHDGLPYVNGFCAPHWRWNEAVVGVLDEIGWWGAVDRRQPKMPCPKRFYRYSHCIDEPFWDDFGSGQLKLHGHVYGTSNDLGRCFDNLLKLPREVEWYFATDFIEEKR